MSDTSESGTDALSLQAARAEIERLHEFFVAWITGRGPSDDKTYQAGLLDHLSEELVYVMPGGEELTYGMLRDGMRKAHGSNPDFAIAIRQVALRHADERSMTVSYLEWQRNARQSKPADNGRYSTVLFARDDDGRLRWKHLQETWLPPEEMASGPYDF